jgi:putative endonuclease
MSAREPTGRRTPAQATGGEAEERAAAFLAARGLAIVARNYRTRFGEIDLVAKDGATLVFVEVRMRSSDAYGGAASSVTRGKRRRIESAARVYLSALHDEPPCRFDVVTLEGEDTAWLRAAFDASAG